jgi:CheY-like chemotaxis protein
MNTKEQSDEIFEYLKSKNVLICDDDFLVLEYFKLIIGAKLKWELVSNGFEVLERVKKNKYDLILLDLNMANMDGRETFTEIRKINETVPVIAVTADVAFGKREELINFGFSDYLLKNFKKADFFFFLFNFFKNSN